MNIESSVINAKHFLDLQHSKIAAGSLLEYLDRERITRKIGDRCLVVSLR